MAPGSLLGFLLVFCVRTNEAISQKTLQVSPGQNITLPCTTTEKIQDIREVIVEWKINNSCVFVLSDGYCNTNTIIGNRAELADPQLKNGNLSLILRNTQLNDSGVYECWFVGAKSCRKRETSVPKLMTSVTLEVKAVSQKTLEVSPGQTITLPCNITETIQENRKTTIEWKKNGSYVVIFRSGKDVSADQDPQFKNRAEMADPELKNGNLSLILRNIQLSDSGTYDCFFLGSGSRKKRSTDDLITSVTLKVKEPRHRLPLIVFAVFAVVLLGGVVFLMFRTRQKQKESPETSAESDRLSVTE